MYECVTACVCVCVCVSVRVPVSVKVWKRVWVCVPVNECVSVCALSSRAIPKHGAHGGFWAMGSAVTIVPLCAFLALFLGVSGFDFIF